MTPGCYTAIITPFHGGEVDMDGLAGLVEFQVANGVAGIVAVGTTGESPTLTWDEHNRVIVSVAELTRGKGLCIAGTGSNNTSETLSATEHAVRGGADAVLLVDPYYNGPSSLEIRREYLEPVAAAFPEIEVIPYVIPGRTGTRLLPEDLAIAGRNFSNISTVKEATGDFDNMRRIRSCCGEGFSILSGDDNLTCAMMTDPGIKACGVVSVYSNIFPKEISAMVGALASGDENTGRDISNRLAPLFELVTVTTSEKTPFGPVTCRARNPLPVKTLMSILGMPSGGCRRPLGRMTRKGIELVLDAARKVFETSPEFFEPVAEFFDTDVEARLNDPSALSDLAYNSY
ncbi:MAG: 4-hydroxy-tetrahydrodipicolinate synthase [Desulfococcus sp. 4484_241]|nr:MAG: 4-hydroxy-tetrahydrodipicolinate synthase [Desulfococcus sp. 4484_241]